MLGLVLAGGAARGAYEAGVLRYLFCTLPRELGRPWWPAVVSGTSVGALNGVFAAAREPQRLEWLSRLWQTMQVDWVYTMPATGVVSAARLLLDPGRASALLDPTPLGDLVRREFPSAALGRALGSGALRGVIVSATEVATGSNTMFVETSDPDLNLRPLPGARQLRVRLGAEHLLASAALPVMFPPVRIEGTVYVDGGLRQNTPLRPVWMAGCTRAIVVGTSMDRSAEVENRLDTVVPTLPFLVGKTLNALTLDPVERDLRRAEQITEIISWGVRQHGPGFAAGLARELGVRPVRTLYLRPSVDLGRLACTVYRESPPDVTPQLRWLLSAIADRANADEGESDFLSYLLFDRSYTAPMEALGHADAAARAEEIVRFLTSPDPLLDGVDGEDE